MRTRPPELTDDDVRAALARGWDLDVRTVTYRPVGFGSHHWDVAADDRRWFLTIDDLAAAARSSADGHDVARHRLDAALTAARDLADGGLRFVVAPTRSTADEILVPIGERFVAALYPHVNGVTREWGAFETVADRLAVLDLVVQVHAATSASAGVEDLTIPRLDELRAAMDDLARPWASGPYAEPARALLGRHAVGLDVLLEHHAGMAARIIDRPERMVLTHGEPHPGNTIVTLHGLVLVDWDTTLVAPPERDLWTVAGAERTVVDAYERRTGRAVLVDVLDTYRLSWDLIEVAIYIALLRGEHTATDDVRESWRNLQHFLDPAARWPALVT